MCLDPSQTGADVFSLKDFDNHSNDTSDVWKSIDTTDLNSIWFEQKV